MPAEWDTRLPDPQLVGINEDGAYPVLVSESKDAKIFTREVSQSSLNMWGLSLQLTTKQLGYFEYWWANEANNGISWINNVPMKKGQSRQLLQMRFVSSYSASYIGYELWNVNFIMESDE